MLVWFFLVGIRWYGQSDELLLNLNRTSLIRVTNARSFVEEDEQHDRPNSQTRMECVHACVA